jgi:hypothetical protein
MKRLLSLLMIGVLFSAFASAAPLPASLTPVKSTHHRVHHRAHRAGRHHAHRRHHRGEI